MLSIENVTKRFGKKEALAHVNLSLQPGRIFGLLGTNGAGKSTLLRVAAGILRPEEGAATLGGRPVFGNPEAMREICYVSDEPTFLHGATINDMAAMHRAYYPAHDDARLKALCSRFALPMDERIAGFSKGTQKRAQICLALACRPKALLCDETFDGLDPVMREAFKRELGAATIDEGLMTVLAGHNQQEMEDICDSVGFLHEGKLLTSGDLDSVLAGIHKIQCVLPEEPAEGAFEGLSVLRIQRQGRLIVLTARGDAERTRARLAGLSPVYLEELPLSLEEVFILEMEEQGYAK